MSNKRPRIIGTTPETIARAEKAIGRLFPQSFRAWLTKNNGRWGLDAIRVFPVLDDRDPRSTWDSIDRQFHERWKQWRNIHAESDLSHLLPFAEFGTGDYYCFDYSKTDSTGESPVVLWSHETGETEERADSYGAFVLAIEKRTIRD
jgi:hypothetical protein